MLKILLRKQMAEIFRAYLYNAKKNTARSKASTILMFLLFGALMAFLAVGMFGVLSFSLSSMIDAGFAWFYFALMGLIALLLGAFGAIFSTYTGLYLAKDNDLLLAMPISIHAIMASRLLSVYLMGLMYSAVATIPAVVIYFFHVPFTASRLVCAVLWVLLVSLIVMVLSCLLGYGVARLSLKIKRKSLATTVLALAGMGLYYFVYFKAIDLVQDMLVNVAVYGEKVKGAAYGLYLFGQSAAGDWLALAIVSAVVLAACILTWLVLQRSFLKVATATGAVAQVKYTERTARQQSISSALLGKELGRFTSSSNYMLNCGLGVLLMVLAGTMLLIKGQALVPVLTMLLANRPGAAAALACAVACMALAANDMAAPSVALEGKNLWIAKSLPVSGWQVLRAKLDLQLLLTVIPTLFLCLCLAVTLPLSAAERVFVFLLPLIFMVFSACLGLFMGLQNPNLNWTNEIYPMKQSLSVTVALLGGWAYALALGGVYMWVGWKLGAVIYLGIFSIATLIVAALLYRWLRKRGAAAFEAL